MLRAVKTSPEAVRLQVDVFRFQFLAYSLPKYRFILTYNILVLNNDVKIRKFYNSTKFSREAPFETVSKLPEHADIKTTQIYAKVIDKNKREAVDKLDGMPNR